MEKQTSSQNESSAAPEAPSSANTRSCPWSAAPASSAEYDTYKREIQQSVSFESVCGKINPYTGFKIQTQEDYQLYCDFLLQQKINEVRLSKANERITILEAELSSLRQQCAGQPKVKQPPKSTLKESTPAQKPIFLSKKPLNTATITSAPNAPVLKKRTERSGSMFLLTSILMVLTLLLAFPSTPPSKSAKGKSALQGSDKLSDSYVVSDNQEDGEEQEGYVYINPESNLFLYHTNPDCKYLDSGRSAVKKDDLASYYSLCDECKKSGFGDEDTQAQTEYVYINPDDGYVLYHTNLTCRLLTSNYVAVPKADVESDHYYCYNCKILDAGESSTSSHFSGSANYDSTPSTETAYIGNAETKVFHRSSCSYLPAKENQVAFSTRSAAVGQGYTPCGHCNP